VAHGLCNHRAATENECSRCPTGGQRAW